jgi:hypothetical protein
VIVALRVLLERTKEIALVPDRLPDIPRLGIPGADIAVGELALEKIGTRPKAPSPQPLSREGRGA